MIRVEQGKDREDRHVMLSQHLLDLLRAWWLAARSKGIMSKGGWLLQGQNPVNPLTTGQLGRSCQAAAKGGQRRVSPAVSRRSAR